MLCHRMRVSRITGTANSPGALIRQEIQCPDDPWRLTYSLEQGGP